MILRKHLTIKNNHTYTQTNINTISHTLTNTHIQTLTHIILTEIGKEGGRSGRGLVRQPSPVNIDIITIDR